MTNTQKKSPKETPLMAQYNAIKAQNRDSILFFRMGDFYEMFNEDAKTGAKVLGITLTSRGHGKTGDVPLAGFPHHALEGYLAKMVKAGYRVAICEQVEDPKLAKGIVKRDVIQVVTPGTLMEDKLLEAGRNNFLSSVYLGQNRCGLASVDVSTGEFLITEFEKNLFYEELQALSPSEILIAESQETAIRDLLPQGRPSPLTTRREDWLFSREYGYEILTRHFKTASLKGFGVEAYHEGLAAAGAAMNYVAETQKTDLSHIRKITPYSDDDFMALDASTRNNLEITNSLSASGQEGTLISLMDRTRTPMGGRIMAGWLQRPLKKLAPIRNRLDSVETLFNQRDAREDLTEQLKGISDIERLITRVVTRRANARDLAALKRTLIRIPRLTELMTPLLSEQLTAIKGQLDPCTDITNQIEAAIVDDPPAQLGDGGVFREGYHAELDELRKLAFSGKDWIARLQQTEREKTGISSLKVGYNKVFGYYLEVTKTHLSKVPDTFIRKQTLVNAERFITPELKEAEEKILHAEEKMTRLEHELFEDLRNQVAAQAGIIQTNGRLIGELDAFCSMATLAEENKFTKPVVNDGDQIIIHEGRHPVVEQLLPPGTPFIPNDIVIDNTDQQLLIITGPNMAGKSTFIRQVGLLVLMAQIGSFVPATEATVGVVDRIFTRVGAQDNLAGGESTFLVEMNETANIINNATPKSLILLDEIGRGTSTFDGLSIAWAVAEFIHNHPSVQAKTLFATHYHELTELERILPGAKNYNVAVKEWGDHIVFLRKIVPGGCDHSYGIQVARLAGLPLEIIQRAKEILHNLEANELTPNEMPKLAMGAHGTLKVAEPQMNFFAEEESKLRKMLKEIDINNLTPMEALQKLDELKKGLSEG